MNSSRTGFYPILDVTRHLSRMASPSIPHRVAETAGPLLRPAPHRADRASSRDTMRRIAWCDHHRRDGAVLGVDRGGVDERGDAASVWGREHDLLDAHRLSARASGNSSRAISRPSAKRQVRIPSRSSAGRPAMRRLSTIRLASRLARRRAPGKRSVGPVRAAGREMPAGPREPRSRHG